MNSDKHLDEQIKQALEKLQARLDNRAWEAFEQRLDQEAAQGDASTSDSAGTNAPSFDEVISNKLNQLEAPLSAGDWSMMEKMIEADETAELLENEAALDNLVIDKFEKFEVTFQPHHWQMMAHRLEEEFFFRYHLWRCKAAEVGLMLLLLLTIVHYTPEFNDQYDGEHFEQPTLPLYLSPKSLEPIAPAKPQVEPPAKPIAAIGNSANLNSIAASTQKTRHAAVNHNPENTAFKSLTTNDFVRNEMPIESLPSLSIGAVNTIAHPTTLQESMAEHRLLNNTISTPSMSDGFVSNSALIASLGPQPLQSSFAWEVMRLPQPYFEKGHQLRFSIFTSTDAAYVITPPNKYSVFDTLVAVDEDTTLASGYGAGITVSWKKDRWEFQTGGIYSFKRFIPNTPVFLFETVNYYIREEFNGVQLDILQVPFNTSYHFKNDGKWRFYGSLGASGHFITASVYEIKTDRTPSFSNFAMLPRAEGLPDDNKSIREEKNFPDGLFDGGNIHDNFYLTANLGLGMERFVSPRWSVFLQPNYQHHLLTDGIGVNGEKLYNFSFYVGTKVNLK